MFFYSTGEYKNHSIFGIFLFIVFFALAVCIAGKNTKSVRILNSPAQPFNKGWYYYNSDGEKISIDKLPAKIPSASTKARIYRMLETEGESFYLCLYSHHQNITLRLNGTVLYNFTVTGNPPWLPAYRAFYHVAKIPSFSSGELCLETEGLLPQRIGEFREVFAGDQFQIFKTVFEKRAYKLIMGFIMILLGLGIAVIGIMFYVNQKQKDSSTITLGLLSFIIGLWQAEESNLLQFFIGYQPFHWAMEYLTQPLILVMSFLFIQSITNGTWNRTKYIIMGADAVAIGIVILLQLIGVRHLAVTIGIIRTLYIVTCIYLTYLINSQTKEIRKSARIIFTSSMVTSTILFFTIIVGIIGDKYADTILCSSMIIVFVSLSYIVYCRVFNMFEGMKKADLYKNLAYMDVSTEVASRTAYFVYIENFVPEHPPLEYCIMLFDMNNLKVLNDNYGHIEGDKVIKAFATCLKRSFERNGTIYRIGGDEFVFLCAGVSRETVKRMIDSLKYQVKHQTDTPVHFTAAYGHTFFTPMVRDDFYAAQDIADSMMYEQKRKMKLDQI